MFVSADVRFTTQEPDPEEDRATAAAIERDNAWVRRPHHLTLEQMWAEMQREAREQLVRSCCRTRIDNSYKMWHNAKSDAAAATPDTGADAGGDAGGGARAAGEVFILPLFFWHNRTLDLREFEGARHPHHLTLEQM